METFFLEIVNMSITAGWLIGAVLLLRFAMKKAPKWMCCALWALVGFRLICPFSIESALSLIPSAQTISPDILYAKEPTINSGIPVINHVMNPVLTQSFAPDPANSVNPLQVWSFIAACVWVMGMAGMLVYALISYFRLRRRVRAALQIRDNVWICDDIQTPFLLGLIKPKIYLPSGMPQEQQSFVIAHELAHIHRWDHWWKPLGFAVLTLHWFNPLVWLAYILLCRDIELACDERVIKRFALEDKKAYSHTLLQCSASRKWIAACPLAFGEVGVKERIKTVLSYKKPAFWIILIALIASIAVAVCFLTNPIEEKQVPGWSSAQSNPDGVTFTSMGIFWEDNKLFAKAELYNGSKRQIVFDSKILIYRDDVCITPEDTIWNEIAYVLEPGGKKEMQLDLSQYTFDQPGVYRLEKEYFVDGGDKALKVRTELPLYFDSVDGRINPPLTLDDVIRLSKEKELTPRDFMQYRYRRIGSGLDIWLFEIDELFVLQLTNWGLDEPLEGVILGVRDGTDEYINICTQNVKAFIKKHKDNPVVPELLWGYTRFPVGDAPEIMEKMQQLAAPNMEPGAANQLPYYPVRSLADLQAFRDEFEELFDYSKSYIGHYTFAEAVEYCGYDAEFFETKKMVLVYYIGQTGQDSPDVKYVRQYEGNQLRLCVTATEKSFWKEKTGWLLMIEMDKGTIASSESTKVLIEVYDK